MSLSLTLSSSLPSTSKFLQPSGLVFRFIFIKIASHNLRAFASVESRARDDAEKRAAKRVVKLVPTPLSKRLSNQDRCCTKDFAGPPPDPPDFLILPWPVISVRLTFSSLFLPFLFFEMATQQVHFTARPCITTMTERGKCAYEFSGRTRRPFLSKHSNDGHVATRAEGLCMSTWAENKGYEYQ